MSFKCPLDAEYKVGRSWAGDITPTAESTEMPSTVTESIMTDEDPNALTPTSTGNGADVLVPDYAEAERHLKLIDPIAKEFTFQIIDDNKDWIAAAGGKDERARNFSGTLARCWPTLVMANEDGCGIFVTVNRTDLKGRGNGNIKEIRWWFADLDGSPIPADCPPAIMRVESSAGNWHLYFRPGDRALTAFKPAQQAIAAFCHGDKVDDLPRVMRLAGFIHNKIKTGDPKVNKGRFLTRIVEVNETARAVTIDDFLPTATIEDAEEAASQEAGKDAPAGVLDDPGSLLTQMAADEGLGFTDQEAVVSPWRALNTLALTNLSKWVPDLLGDIAKFQQGTGAYRIKGAAMGGKLVAALGRDSEVTYEEDLSIHPSGIIDYGVATDAEGKPTGLGNYSALDLVMAVLGLEFDGASAWLIERLYEPQEQDHGEGGKAGTGGASGNGSDGGGGNSAQPGLGTAPEPKPARKTDELPILHPDALHGIAGEIALTILPHTESDIPALVTQTIVQFGSIIGRGPYCQIEDDKHYTNLFEILIGESSWARKGTSAGRIHAISRRADPYWDIYCNKSGCSSGEGLLEKIRDRHEYTDARGKEHVDEGVADKRLLLEEEEMHRALTVMKRDGNILSEVIRKAWDGKPLRTLVREKNRPLTVMEPHVSIIGHITKDELIADLNHTSLVNGFANRFLFVVTKRSKDLPEGGETLDDEIKDVLATRLRMAIENARSIGKVEMSPATREIWRPLYSKLMTPIIGLYGDVCKRGATQMRRLMMIYALLDNSAVVEPIHLRAALALWNYCAASAKFVFGDMLGEKVADEILTALRQEQPAGLSRTLISALLGRNCSLHEINMALQKLLRAGKARFTTRKQEGAKKPTETWFATLGESHARSDRRLAGHSRDVVAATDCGRGNGAAAIAACRQRLTRLAG
jgi:hypothetical protein